MTLLPQAGALALARTSNTTHATRMRNERRWLMTSLFDWIGVHVSGCIDVARSNSLGAMLHLVWCNTFKIKRRVRLKINGFDINLRAGTPDFSVAIESLGREFEPVTAGFAHENGALIIDAGGYIGTAAIKLATAYPACRIVCIEPSSENLELLKLNVAAYPNISVMKAALAANGTEVALRDPGRKAWGFTIIAEPDQSDRVLETVPAVTIENILAQHGRERVFILKLDVEGAEAELFHNSRGWMSRTDILIAELHEWLIEGSEAAFRAATGGRANTFMPGEKVLSLHPARVAAQ